MPGQRLPWRIRRSPIPPPTARKAGVRTILVSALNAPIAADSWNSARVALSAEDVGSPSAGNHKKTVSCRGLRETYQEKTHDSGLDCFSLSFFYGNKMSAEL